MGFVIENGKLIKYISEKNVTEITIPDTVTSIGRNVFYRTKKLTAIMVPESVRAIDESVFSVQILTFLHNGRRFRLTPVSTLSGIRHDSQALRKIVRFLAQPSYLTYYYLGAADYQLRTALYYHDIDPRIAAHLREEGIRLGKDLIEAEDLEALTAFCETGLLTQKALSQLVDHAIDHTQQGGSTDPQLLLMRCQHEQFGGGESTVFRL